MMDGPPKLVYLAYKFTGNPTENTAKARDMALKIMKKHTDWFIIVPHFAIDAMLDGVVDWGKSKNNFTKWRRTQAGMMSIAFLMNVHILVLGCEPTYANSSGVTWEHVVAQIMNRSYRRTDPIEIMTIEEALE